MKEINFNDYAIKLSGGGHESPQEGMCAMEAVAYLAGEVHSWKPRCACPMIAELMVAVNDSGSQWDRDALLPYVLQVIGTRVSPAVAEERYYRALDFIVHGLLPRVNVTQFAWLREAMPRIKDGHSLHVARMQLNEVQMFSTRVVFALKLPHQMRMGERVERLYFQLSKCLKVPKSGVAAGNVLAHLLREVRYCAPDGMMQPSPTVIFLPVIDVMLTVRDPDRAPDDRQLPVPDVASKLTDLVKLTNKEFA